MFAESIFNKDLIEFCKHYDYLIPVPIDKCRMSQRGYNQSYLIAKEIVKNINEYYINNSFNCDELYNNKKRNSIISNEMNCDEKHKILINNISKKYDLNSNLKCKTNHIEFENKILFKQKNIKPQSTMNSREDRITNIKDAFSLKNLEQIKNRKIVIFDDIFTTGSTANECAKILKNYGALKVGIITIAKD